jgi:hypothetical protein
MNESCEMHGQIVLYATRGGARELAPSMAFPVLTMQCDIENLYFRVSLRACEELVADNT